MIEIKEKSQCCGCTACSSICPKKAIMMKQDEEGFMYPIIDKSKCVNCGLCDKVCPVKNAKENGNNQHAYIFQNADDKIRRESTSGGAFTAIAEYVIDNNGIVYGAVFDEKYKVIHKGIDNKEELYKFRNSKYVQSEMENCYSEIKEYLNKGKLVCFSGTSCQVEGLKNYLGKHYENLILVDVVCRAVPSPLIWKKYLNMIKELCNKKNISVSELARRIGQTPQNFGKKLKRDTVTLEELKQIADVMEVTFEQSFVFPDGEQIRTSNE